MIALKCINFESVTLSQAAGRSLANGRKKKTHRFDSTKFFACFCQRFAVCSLDNPHNRGKEIYINFSPTFHNSTLEIFKFKRWTCVAVREIYMRELRLTRSSSQIKKDYFRERSETWKTIFLSLNGSAAENRSSMNEIEWKSLAEGEKKVWCCACLCWGHVAWQKCFPLIRLARLDLETRDARGCLSSKC